MNEPSQLMQTVAVWLPDCESRVLVTKLVGSEQGVQADAKAIVQDFFNVAPAHWLTKVVACDEVTDIHFPETP